MATITVTVHYCTSCSRSSRAFTWPPLLLPSTTVHPVLGRSEPSYGHHYCYCPLLYNCSRSFRAFIWPLLLLLSTTVHTVLGRPEPPLSAAVKDYRNRKTVLSRPGWTCVNWKFSESLYKGSLYHNYIFTIIIIIIIIILELSLMLPNQNKVDPRWTKKASSVQYGKIKSGTRAQWFPNTCAWEQQEWRKRRKQRKTTSRQY